MCSYLIDYENVCGKNLAKMGHAEKGDHVFVLYPQTQPDPGKKADVKGFLGDTGEQARCIKVRCGKKNALDFQLCAQLGILAGQNPSETFHVVSNDAGFDFVTDFLTGEGYAVDRVTSGQGVGKLVPKAKPKPRPRPVDKLTDKLAGLLAKKGKPEEVRKILKANKTATKVHGALGKLHHDSGHTCQVYRKIKSLIGK